MSDFDGRVALVTGATGNVGTAVSKAFLDAGARVAVAGTRRDRLDELYGGDARALPVVVDLFSEPSVAEMVRQVMEALGRIDVLANVAGGFTMGPPLHETSTDVWDQMMGLNARSVFLASRAVVPHMVEEGAGRIINVSARAALQGKAGMGPYCASKAVVITLTQSMAEELKDHHINVNCVLPGTIDTPENRAAMPGSDFVRWVSPEAIADVILQLASDSTRAVTGAAVPVYGRS